MGLGVRVRVRVRGRVRVRVRAAALSLSPPHDSAQVPVAAVRAPPTHAVDEQI